MIGLNILLVIFFHDKRYEEAIKEVQELVENSDMAEYKAYLILKQGQISELQGRLRCSPKFLLPKPNYWQITDYTFITIYGTTSVFARYLNNSLLLPNGAV